MTDTSPTRPGTPQHPERDFDLVLVGATGFVGRLTARYLAGAAPADLRIAVAGRSRARLDTVVEEIGGAALTWGQIIVDTRDAQAVGDLARRARAVVTTVGPYAAYGRKLVHACAEAGTNYCDLTGEVLFVRDSIDENNALAEATGARIVHSCGFDSVPSDLGVLELADVVATDGEGTLGETVLHVRSLRGGISGGTIDSMRQQAIEVGADKARRRIAADSYSLTPDRTAEPPSRNRGPAPTSYAAKVAAQVPVTFDEITRRWTAPFFMGPYNTRIVRRSNAISGYAYGKDFRYEEVMDTGTGPLGAVRAGLTTAAIGGLFAGMSHPVSRAALDRILPAPGEGPSEESMAKGRFVIDIETTTTTGARFRSRVAADHDPGYSGTAIMLGQAGLALATDDPRMPDRAGVLTPATGIGQAYIDRLREAGFTIDARRVS